MHRRPVVLPLVLAAALSLPGCGDQAVAGPGATTRCDAPEFPALQFGSHLIGTAVPPVAYSSTPPTSGWHASGAPPVGVQAQPLSEPQMVSALEAGGVVIAHHDVPAAELQDLVDLVDEDFPGQVVVTDYDQIDPGSVVLTSWGALQRCDGVDLEAVRAYATAYGNPIEAHTP